MNENQFVADIRSQADALRRVLAGDVARGIGDIARTDYDRVVWAGMGASLFANYPAWLACTRAGLAAWSMDAGELLQDARGLITDQTLLILTSNSGESVEIRGLLDAIQERRPACVLGITDVETSTLGQKADRVVPILSGKEHSVSTRSYVNSLVAAQIVAGVLSGTPVDLDPFKRAADALDAYFDADWDSHVAAVSDALGTPDRMLVIGRGAGLGTAWQGALVIKEVAKINAEAMAASQYRHGPFELTDERLTMIIVEGDPATAGLNRRLGTDMAGLGAHVLWIGANPPPGVAKLPTADAPGVSREVVDVMPLDIVGVILAEAAGVVPGKFRLSGDIIKKL
jgi:glucosamine--fructose-6-phosphate aminotransferase (isomerizing)